MKCADGAPSSYQCACQGGSKEPGRECPQHCSLSCHMQRHCVILAARCFQSGVLYPYLLLTGPYLLLTGKKRKLCGAQLLSLLMLLLRKMIGILCQRHMHMHRTGREVFGSGCHFAPILYISRLVVSMETSGRGASGFIPSTTINE